MKIERTISIEVPIYQRQVVVCIGSVRSAAKALEKYCGADVSKEVIAAIECQDITNTNGVTLLTSTDDIVMWLGWFDNESVSSISLLCHELEHAVYFLLSDVVSMPHKDASDEAYAYLSGWLAGEILHRLKDEESYDEQQESKGAEK